VNKRIPLLCALILALLIGLGMAMLAPAGAALAQGTPIWNLWFETQAEVAAEIGLPFVDGSYVRATGHCEDTGPNPLPGGVDDTENERFAWFPVGFGIPGPLGLAGYLSAEPLEVLHRQEFSYLGLPALRTTLYFPELGGGYLLKFALVELEPGGWYGFEAGTACYDAYGDDIGWDPWDHVLVMLEVFGRYGWSAPEGEPSSEAVPQMDTSSPEVQSANSTMPKGQLPLMVGATVAGALAGAAAGQGAVAVVSRLRGARRKPAPPGLVRSPVDGKFVTPQQAQFERQQLGAGYTYNPQRDAFEYVPKPERQSRAAPSYLSGQIAKARAQAAARGHWLDEAIQKVHQERIEAYREDIDYYSGRAEKYAHDAQRWDRAYKVASTVQVAADVGVEVCATLTGPAGKGIKKVYEVTKDAIDLADRVGEHGARGAVSFVVDKAIGEAKDKVLEKVPIPMFKSENKVRDAIGNAMVDKAVDMKADEILSPVTDPLNKLILGK